MGTKTKALRLRVETIKNVELMARAENRSFTNMVETLLKKAIRDKKE